MEAAANIHNLLSILFYQFLFSADIKDVYWAINLYIDNPYYFTFYIPGIGQVQHIHMLQRNRSLFFIFCKLVNLILRPILYFQL